MIVHVTKLSNIIVIKGGNLIDEEIFARTNKHLIYVTDLFIFIDHTKKERKIQNHLAKITVEEMKEVIQVKVSYKKITVNCLTIRWNENTGALVACISKSFGSPTSTQWSTF